MPLAKLASTNQKHYPDLVSASDWSCRLRSLLQPIRSTTQIWVVTRHRYGICALVSQTSTRGETVSGVAKCPLFSHATLPGRRLQLDTFSSNGVGSIKIAKCAIFSRNCAISCDTRAHFLLGRRVKEKQKKWRRK